MDIKKKISSMIAGAKNTTYSELSKTDWYYTRKYSRNIEVPAEVEEARTAIIDRFNSLEASLNAIDTDDPNVDGYLEIVKIRRGLNGLDPETGQKITE